MKKILTSVLTIGALCAVANDKELPQMKKTNRITDYRKIQNWENYFLASAVCSVAKAAGAENTDYRYYSAFTGDMFAYLYMENPDKPNPSDSGITNYYFTPESVKLAFAAFGQDCLYLSNADIKKDFRAAMDAVKKSIDAGIPVVAWGMGNVVMRSGNIYDPLTEGCLIGGYDGDALLVNLYPGPERLPEGTVDADGYSRIVNGLDSCPGLFIVNGKLENHDMRKIYETAIAAIPGLLQRPASDGTWGGRYVFGKTAFELWAKTLETESFFENKSNAELNGVWWDLHGSPYCCVCTSDARGFMKMLAEKYPDWTLVAKLAPLYAQMEKHRQEIWDLQGGFFPPMEKFGAPEFRAQIAASLRKMGGVCDEILQAFENTETTNPKEQGMQPRIITKKFTLAGLESPPIDFQSDFEPVLNALRQRVRDALPAMQGVVEPARMVGFWQPGGRYFTGVETSSETAPEGFVMKQLPESLYALFVEQRRGTMGGPGGKAYQWLRGSSVYTHNAAVPGDFEVFQNMAETAPDQQAEIMIPIAFKTAFRGINEMKAHHKEFEIFKVPASRLIGKEKSLPLHGAGPLPARPFWEECFASEEWEKTIRVLPQVIPESNFGWTCDYVPATDTFSYLCSVLTPAGTPVPEGWQFRDVPETLAAVGLWGDRLMEDVVPKLQAMGFEPAWGDAGCGWNAELYLHKEKVEDQPPDGNAQGCRWVVPCKKR